VGTLAFGTLLLLSYSGIFEHFLAASLGVRVLVAALLIFPTAFFMGMCFPLGILAIKNAPPGAIAWAWGMNGLFTTIGGLLAAILSMFWGLRATLTTALAIYLLAGLAFMLLRKQLAISNAPRISAAQNRPGNLDDLADSGIPAR
jgi:hypothetical protein